MSDGKGESLFGWITVCTDIRMCSLYVERVFSSVCMLMGSRSLSPSSCTPAKWSRVLYRIIDTSALACILLNTTTTTSSAAAAAAVSPATTAALPPPPAIQAVFCVVTLRFLLRQCKVRACHAQVRMSRDKGVFLWAKKNSVGRATHSQVRASEGMSFNSNICSNIFAFYEN